MIIKFSDNTSRRKAPEVRQLPSAVGGVELASFAELHNLELCAVAYDMDTMDPDDGIEYIVRFFNVSCMPHGSAPHDPLDRPEGRGHSLDEAIADYATGLQGKTLLVVRPSYANGDMQLNEEIIKAPVLLVHTRRQP